MTLLLYLDTNVILARYAPEEPQHLESRDLLKRIEGGEMTAVTSTLTLVEVVSVTSRACERFRAEDESLRREEVAAAFLRRVMTIRNLDFIYMGGEASIRIEKRCIKLPALLAVALEIGSKIGVKTLDSLHLAAASIASTIYDYRIDYFVTLDRDILRRRERIDPLIRTEVVTPAEVINRETL